MPFHPSTSILTAIVMIVLIPMLHLSLHLQDLSAWFLKGAFTSSAESQQLSTPSAAEVAKSSLRFHQEHELIYDLGNVSYFTPTHAPVATFPFVPFANNFHNDNHVDYLPAAVLQVAINKTVITANDLDNIIHRALSFDDVISASWLENLILLPDLHTGESSTISFLDWQAIAALYKDYGVKRVFVDATFYLPTSANFKGMNVEVNRLLPPALTTFTHQGPYLMAISNAQYHLQLYLVYRLYSDIYRAFLFGMYRPSLFPLSPPGRAKYNALRAVDQWGYNFIPVSSRLYWHTPHHNGVQGQRIAVKGELLYLYDVHGVVTSAGNRKYGELYGAANTSADSILLLEALGGALVGKTKTSTFAMGSKGNVDTVDEQYPFSARGDGWQTCSGSSSGSACAMGAYDWLDFAIGSDTGSSVRHPAAVVGLYGNRPSIGAISLQGVKPLLDYADTLCVLARDPHNFQGFVKAWYGASPLHLRAFPKLPNKILVATDYLQQTNPAAQEIIDMFLCSLNKTMEMTLVDFDLDGKFAEGNFTRKRNDALQEKLLGSLYWWSWQKIGKQFQADYAASHGGQYAPVDPWAKYAWTQAEKNGSWSKYRAGIKDAEEFKEFFNTQILPFNREACSEAILIYDIGQRKSLYRESDLEAQPKLNTSMDGVSICPWAGCVDHTIPIGQVPYQSMVSHVEEQRPVTISLVAHPGCDFMLLDFVNKLAENGLIQAVKTGRNAF